MANRLWKKLREPRIWRRVYVERLGEPLIYNVASLFVALFGSVKRKIEYDLVVRQPYAFSILEAAMLAKIHGIEKLTLMEFGVANGAGLHNMCMIAEMVSKETGVQFAIIGLDSGEGMPPARDYRDQPEEYFSGDFPVADKRKLVASLPPNARILFGDIKQSLKTLADQLEAPIGFIVIDVDYYWSTKESLDVLLFDAEHYLPMVFMYFDDVQGIKDNVFCGELLAIQEFNADPSHPLRRLGRANFLKELRIFKRAIWHKQIYIGHIFDHSFRSVAYIEAQRNEARVLTNPYL